ADNPSEYIGIDDVTADALIPEFEDGLFTTNSDLADAYRPVLDHAAERLDTPFHLVVLDINPVDYEDHTSMYSLAENLVDHFGGTVMVRTPHAAVTASDTLAQGALNRATAEMIQTETEPTSVMTQPEALDLFLAEATDWAWPWMLGSLAVGAIIAI